MKKLTQIAFSVIAVLTLQGCASIVSGTMQPLSVTAQIADGSYLDGAKCTLTNNKGQWFVTTPGSVTVQRSFEDLVVGCTNQQLYGNLSVKSTTKPMAFGNILFGGIIGVGVDMSTGAAYDYPNILNIRMESRGKDSTLPALNTDNSSIN